MDQAISEIKITDKFLKDRPLSASSLKAFGGLDGSPKQYIDYITKPRIDTDAFIIGRATEAMIYKWIAPKYFKFDDQFQVYKPFRKAGDKAKEKWATMLQNAKDNGVTLISREMLMQCKRMAECAMDTPETRYYLDRVAKDKDGHPRIQEKIFWIDKKTGLPVIGYIDFIVDIDGYLIIVDIKTSADGGPDKFERNSLYLNNQIQVGTYLTGFHKRYYQFPDFMFMVLDKQSPFDAIMMHTDAKYNEAAKDEFAHVLTGFRHCMDKNEFHRGRAFWSSEMGYFSMRMSHWDLKKLKHTNDED